MLLDVPDEYDLSGKTDEELVQLTLGIGRWAHGDRREEAHVAEAELNLRLKREIARLHESLVRFAAATDESSSRMIGLTVWIKWLTIALALLAVLQLGSVLINRDGPVQNAPVPASADPQPTRPSPETSGP